MSDAPLRDLERQLEKDGYGDIVRYVNAVRRASTLALQDVPEQSAPLWDRMQIGLPVPARSIIVVPLGEYDGVQRTRTSFSWFGLSVFLACHKNSVDFEHIRDNGLMRIEHVLSGRVWEIPMRLLATEPAADEDGLAPSTPAWRMPPRELQATESMSFSVLQCGIMSLPVSATVIMHGIRHGGW